MKKITISLLLIVATFLFFAGCKKNKPPETPNKPSGPIELDTNEIGQYTTQSHDPNKDDDIRYIFDWGDASERETTRYYINDMPASLTHSWIDTGNYQIRVKAQDNNDAFSKEWSDSLVITVIISLLPNTPEKPSGPTFVGLSTINVYKTKTHSPTQDEIRYFFDWGDGQIDTTDYYFNDSTAYASHAWTDTEQYYVKAKAQDKDGGLSNWSDSLVVTVVTSLLPNTPEKPSGPTLVGRFALNVYTTKTHSPANFEIRYFFDWGDGQIDTTDYYASDSTAYANHTWTNLGQYYVKAKAQDEDGGLSNWSDELGVTVLANSPPNKPFIIGDPYGHPNRQYTFKTILTDPNGDSVAAKFFWGNGRTPSWSTFYENGDTIRDTITYTEADTYEIRVVAKDIWGAISDTSNLFHFIVRSSSWSFLPGELGEEFNSSPALITSGNAVTHVIIGCNDGYVYCLDSLGDSLWVYPPENIYTGDAFNASPVIGPDNKIYIGDEEGRFHGINSNGTPIWDPPLMIANGYYLNSSPAINAAGDMIYVGCENETLYAVNTGTGSIEWKFGASAGITASPAIAADGAIVFGDENDSAGGLYILNPDGSERHTFYAAGPIFSSPAINGDTIYFSASETLFYAIDMNGNLLHTYLPEVRDEVFSSPIIGANGIVYFGDLTGRLYALNPDLTPVSGWPILITDEITSSATIGSDNLIYFVGNDDYLYAWSSTGGPLPDWKVKLGYSKSRKQEALKPSPAIGPNGWIYVASENGIYGFKRNMTLANTPWPMFRHDIKHTGRVGGGR